MKPAFICYTRTPGAFRLGQTVMGKVVNWVKFSHVDTFDKVPVAIYEVRGVPLHS